MPPEAVIDSPPTPPAPAPSSAASMPDYPDPNERGKMGREILRNKMNQRFGKVEAPSTEKPVPPAESTAPKAAEKLANSFIDDEPSPPAEPAPEAPKAESDTEPVKEPEKGKRESPWKIVETYKARCRTLEKELADTKASIKPESDFQALQKELEQTRATLKEREEFVRLHNYEKSQEYQEKYKKPWEQAWQKVAKKMSEIAIIDPATGAERQATVMDIERLVNAPLGLARKMADEAFGTFANDAMGMRERLLEMYDAQNEAIQKAKAEGETHEKTLTEQQQREQAKLKEEVSKTWAQANQEILEDPKIGNLFKPREGDEEWNKRLAKGTEIVDKAMSAMRPFFPEGMDKAEVVKLHAALYHRARAFGPLRAENEKLRNESKTWKEKYEAIAKSSPPAGTGAPRSGADADSYDPRARFREGIRKAASH